MTKAPRNYAFIDAQNLNLGIRSLGWKLDYKKFRKYLTEKYAVDTAYMFLGFVNNNQRLYSKLQKSGFVLIFKPVIADAKGNVKGNVDVDLTLQVMIDLEGFDKAVIITSDGDFGPLVRHLCKLDKLEVVLSPNVEKKAPRRTEPCAMPFSSDTGWNIHKAVMPVKRFEQLQRLEMILPPRSTASRGDHLR